MKEFTMEKKNLGWIGTGVMGFSMCNHLIDAGHQLYVYNRTREKSMGLVNKGAAWCGSPREVAENSEVIFTIVGFPEDVQRVVLEEAGVLQGARKGAVLVDMTTSSPELALKIHAAAQEAGVSSLDAPVSGGDVGAREATLAIMVGGERETFEATRDLLALMGKTIAYMGDAGSGQHTKMSNQILIAGTMIGVVESLLYAYKAGMELDAVIDVIGSGAAGSWSINNLGRRIAKADFDPGFFIKHFVKDMGIALDEARRMKLALPGLALANQFYVAAMAMGHENLGTQGLYKVFEKMNAIRVA
jgi:3-hydroxyisobutyrate dehydrogenase